MHGVLAGAAADLRARGRDAESAASSRSHVNARKLRPSAEAVNTASWAAATVVERRRLEAQGLRCHRLVVRRSFLSHGYRRRTRPGPVTSLAALP